jgi:hypothetical protein
MSSIRLERRHLAHRIREPAAPLVEEQHAPRASQAAHVVDEERLLPGGQQVRERPADEDDVDRAIAGDLVRNGDVAAAGVLDVRNFHSMPVS